MKVEGIQRIGKVLHVSATTGNLILRLRGEAKVGDTVYDSSLKPVGRVFEIFGPVSEPYASIKPAGRENDRLVNQPLYVLRRGREVRGGLSGTTRRFREKRRG